MRKVVVVALGCGARARNLPGITALHGDGQHHVSLDKMIQTMRDTGAAMKNG